MNCTHTIHQIPRQVNLHPTPSLKSSQRAWELEGSNGSKRVSVCSVTYFCVIYEIVLIIKAFGMSAPEESEVLDDDNHSTAPVQGNAPTSNAASTLALLQKKPAFQMSVHEDFEVLDDDNHLNKNEIKEY
nr:hypothetical protein [Tanacetum cinerariifolium]